MDVAGDVNALGAGPSAGCNQLSRFRFTRAMRTLVVTLGTRYNFEVALPSSRAHPPA